MRRFDRNLVVAAAALVVAVALFVVSMQLNGLYYGLSIFLPGGAFDPWFLIALVLSNVLWVSALVVAITFYKRFRQRRTT
jgi:hypothetical protein